MSGATSTEEKKETSKVIEGVEFRVPLHEKMTKTRFKELYGKKFGDNVDAHYDTLKAIK